jgi:cytochrome c peroxidase
MMRRRIRITVSLCLAATIVASAITLPGGIAQAGVPVPQPPGAETQPLRPLSTVWVPQPGNLADFVQDKSAAIQLGKALFWDTQVGSDGIQACATCHFSAGADTRAKGQVGPGVNAGDTTFQVGGGPNYTLQPSDFPFHLLADPNNADSAVLRDANDVVSSQGVIRRDFVDAPSASQQDAVDRCTHVADPQGFTINGINTRRVEPRNAPTVINAVFNYRNFWDGRANNTFNGVNPFGPRDPNAFIYKLVNGQLITVTVSIPNASLASQAVGPPVSPFEMSCAGRPFAQIGRKLLNPGVVPLGTQAVAPDDSVLGPLAASRTSPGANGLNTSYAALVQQAFRPEYTSTLPVGDGQFTQMEANFSLFFGLAIQLYEATLVSDQTPFDRYALGDTTALTPQQVEGLQVFNVQGRCAACHSGPEFTGASVENVAGERLERMRMGDGALAVYDNGFYNTGVRPTTEDPGNGGLDPFGNPLSDARYFQQLNAPYPINSSIVTTVPGPLQAGERTAVDGAFKTPGLRNVELTGPYMHNGGMATLRQVVDFYNRGGDFAHQNMASLDVRIAPLGLSDDQKNALVAFLLGLTDPRVKWEKAPFDHPSLCVPNGAEGDQTSVVESTPGSGEAKDAAPLCLPAVGAGGAKTPLQPFLGLNPFQALPAISITGKPADPTNDPNPTFTFTVDAGASVQCALDASPYTACTSPQSQSYTGVTDGAHRFKVQATDAAGNVSVASYAFTVDTAPPPLSIDAKPATVSNTTSPAFLFSTTKAGTTFQCSLAPSGGTDSFAPCSTPQSYSGLTDGAYTFKVQATDAAGNVSLASYAFTIDSMPPPLSITGQPASPTNDQTPSFIFSSTKAGTTFKCSLSTSDGPPDVFAPCSSPQGYGPLADGTYIFKAQATDPAGNASVASAAFTIDTVPPMVTITGQPATATNNPNPRFAFASTKAGTSYQCSLSTGADAFAACASPARYGPLADGTYTFKVRGTDSVGNAGTASYTFTVHTVAPVVRSLRGHSAKQAHHIVYKRSSNIAHKRTSKTRQQAQHVLRHQRHQVHHGRVGQRAAPQSALAKDLHPQIGALLRHSHGALRHLLRIVGVRPSPRCSPRTGCRS